MLLHERTSIEYAGRMGGEYLDEIKVYDLSKLTKEQWFTFCELMCRNYELKKASLLLHPDDIPF